MNVATFKKPYVIVIGHRGVGKTSFLKRCKNYFPQIECFDLDQQIEFFFKMPVTHFFEKYGEAHFREKELELAQQLFQKESFLLSAGAGFLIAKLLNSLADDQINNLEIIYLSRSTDVDGRVFLNRPRLNANMSALEESLLRYQEREIFFRKHNSRIYHLPEGENLNQTVEKKILTNEIQLTSAYYTLTNLAEFHLVSQLKKFELRTDFFTVDEIIKMVESCGYSEWLISVRTQISQDELEQLQNLKRQNKNTYFDWALELKFQNLPLFVDIVSSHASTLDQALQQIQPFEESQYHLKLCPVLTTFEQLKKGYEWQKQNGLKRSFLPRSENEKQSNWRWYRQLSFNFQKINFVQGRILLNDQPSLYEYELSQTLHTQGAVLGNPVHHSLTPVYQTHLHQPQKINFISVHLPEFENFKMAVDFLVELGLQRFAVTSPHKMNAGILVEGATLETAEPQNTLAWVQNKWHSTSTDAIGFEQLLKESFTPINWQTSVIVWGGGGVLPALKKNLPQCVEYSAQTGLRREKQSVSLNLSEVQVVIWACGRFKGLKFPEDTCQPRCVIDLNYTENSPALDYVQHLKSRGVEVQYVSGQTMFFKQAQAQYYFWQSFQELNKEKGFNECK